MKKIVLIGLIFGMYVSAFCIEAVDILRKIDNNETYTTIRYDGEMVIRLSGKEYKKIFYCYGKGMKNVFFEFTNPDDAGTKYLKKDGNLFVYSPDTEEVMPITGHMLKESLMGSDMSYEDTVNNDTLEARYIPSIIEETEFDGKKVWVMELVAKKKTESYPKERMWVDKETFSVLKAELFALSGAKLKEMRNLEFRKIGSKYFPVVSEMRDLLRKDSKTVFKMDKIEMDIDIPESSFSLKNLEK